MCYEAGGNTTHYCCQPPPSCDQDRTLPHPTPPELVSINEDVSTGHLGPTTGPVLLLSQGSHSPCVWAGSVALVSCDQPCCPWGTLQRTNEAPGFSRGSAKPQLLACLLPRAHWLRPALPMPPDKGPWTHQVLQSTLMVSPGLKAASLCRQGQSSSATQPPLPSDTSPGGQTQPDTQLLLNCGQAGTCQQLILLRPRGAKGADTTQGSLRGRGLPANSHSPRPACGSS